MNNVPAAPLLLILAHAASTAAHAAPTVRAPEDDPNVLIMRGLDLRRQGKAQQALELFRQAFDDAPSPRTLGQMGLVESSLQLWLDADAHLGAALATPDDAWVHRNRQFLAKAIDRAQQHVGELTLSGPAGTRVAVAGKPIGALPLAAPVRLAEGNVAVTATAEGRKPYSVELTIKGGARAAVSIILEPLDLAAPAPAPPSPPPTLVTPWRRVSAPAGAAFMIAGAAALAWGLTWIALDGRETCLGCGSRYDTHAAGLWLVGGGVVLSLAGGALLYSAFHVRSTATTVGVTDQGAHSATRF